MEEMECMRKGERVKGCECIACDGRINDGKGDECREVHEDTASTRLGCCRHLHKLCLHNPCPQKFHFLGQAGRFSLPPGWLCSSQKRGTSSQILSRRHTQTKTLQSFGFVTSVINKKQTSIRWNHTHNTHWVHLKCTHI